MTDDMLVKPGERLDDLERNNLKIIQDPSRFCFGMDAVLLSGFAHVKPGETVIDLGTGNGIIPILLYGKTEGKHFTGLEIQSENVEMAQRSVQYNKIGDAVDIVEGDLCRATEIFGKSICDVVTSNPPYMLGNHGLVNPDSAKAVARHEVLCTLDDVVRESAGLLRPNGRFYMVHKPDRLAEILIKMSGCGLEAKSLRIVYPYADKEPNMILVEGRKGGHSGMRIQPPLIIYDENGNYVKEVADIYGSEDETPE